MTAMKLEQLVLALQLPFQAGSVVIIFLNTFPRAEEDVIGGDGRSRCSKLVSNQGPYPGVLRPSASRVHDIKPAF